MSSSRSTRVQPAEAPAGNLKLGLRLQVSLFLAALIIRLMHVYFMSSSPYFTHPVIDEQTYVNHALAIAEGVGHPDLIFWQPPGYSYFLALLFKIFGFGSWVPRVMQCLLGAGSVVLTAQIGAHVFGKRSGMLAGIMAAVYGMLVYFDAEFLAPTLTIFIQLCVLRLLIGEYDGNRWKWLLAGFLSGLASIVTATSLLLVMLAAACAKRRAGYVLIGALLMIAPLTARNYVRGGELVLISYNGGLNFYIGNNANYDRTVNIRPGYEWGRLVSEPSLKSARARSNYWFQKSVAFAQVDPLGFLRLQLKKWGLFAAGNEIFRNHAIYPLRLDSPVMSALLWKVPGIAFPWGILFPLALIGLIVGWRQSPILAAWLALAFLGVVSFFVVSRYRVPLVPIMLVFGAGAITHFRLAPAYLKATAMVVGLFAYLWANTAQGEMNHRMNADAEYKLGTQLYQEGKTEAAEKLFRSALSQNPNMPETWKELGDLLLLDGKRADALQAFERASRLDDEDVEVLVKYGKLLADEGHPGEAISKYQRALSLKPGETWIYAYIQAARDQMAGKKDLLPAGEHIPSQAELEQWRTALMNTGDLTWLGKLVNGYERRGEIDAAIEVVQSVSKQIPNDAALLFTLARLYVKHGQDNLAGDFLMRANALAPDSITQWVDETPELKKLPRSLWQRQ